MSYISEQTGDKVQNAIRNRFSQLGKSICKINVIITNMHIQAFMTVRHDKSKGRIQGIPSFRQEFSSESQKKCR